MAGIIDFHTHAFPDPIAATAVAALEKSGKVKAYLDGTVAALLSSMDDAGISRAVVCSIATRPEQFQPIFEWSRAIASERIIAFPSIHPADRHLRDHLRQIHGAGFRGVKLHPYFQDFFLDDPSLLPMFSMLSDLGLLVTLHTGYDISYPQVRRANPERVLNLLKRLPELRLVTTHFGGMNEWAEVQKLLIGRPIYMELSLSLDFLDQIRLRDMLTSHPPEYLLFGTDSPWSDQLTTLKMLKRLDLDPELFDMITVRNGARLLRG